MSPHISHVLQVLVLLEDAERVKEELGKQEEAAARLEDLGKHVCKEAELAPKAKECLALLTPLPALSAAMARRVAKLVEELERQRRLAKERSNPIPIPIPSPSPSPNRARARSRSH